MNNIVWQNIPGIPGYQVSNTGLVKSLPKEFTDKRGRLWRRHGSDMQLRKDYKGYLNVLLCHPHGESRLYKVHRLVANAFIDNPKNLPQVNHLNGDKSDNRVENLEWSDNSKNMIHAYKLGLMPRLTGEFNPCAKLKNNDLPEISKLRKTGMSFRKIGLLFGVSKTCIQYAIKRYNEHLEDGEWVE